MKDEQGKVVAPASSASLPPSSFSFYPGLPPPVNVSLTVLGEHPCSYLPDRVSQSRAVWAEQIPAGLYHRFMDAGFRRSGKLLYQPVCRGCRACLSIRVPVELFRPTKSQRRAGRRNEDLTIEVQAPLATDEKFHLYGRYTTQWHRRPAAEESRESFEQFLYESPVDTLEFTYRDAGGRLLAVGICDFSRESLSSVYFYFEPAEARRGLGTYGALHEIKTAARLGVPYYYLGYWVDGCGAMQYKADYSPAEVLGPDGVWRPLDRPVRQAARGLSTR
jgi:arginyl-tRNA--protein-N-Asp/Glu arginylyltransferase